MAFPELVFILIHTLPCALVNFSYIIVYLCLSYYWCCRCCCYCCCNCSETRKYKWFEKLNSEVRSLLPLFKQGSSPSELLLFNFRVPNSRYFVLMVNCSVIYVVLVAAAIFFQTAFVEEAQCSSVNDNLFCYLNDSNVGCSEFDYSLETANCYEITVRFGDAAKNAAGVFSFYIIAFGLATYIILKLSGGKTGHVLRFCLTLILYYAFSIVLYGLYFILSVGVGYSCPNTFQCIHKYNYLVFMLNVSLTSLSIPWWKFKKVDEERCDEDETQRLIQAS